MADGEMTVAGAYAKIEAHEELCAERYRGINEKLGWVLGALATMFLGLMGWAFVQLYTLEPLRVAAAHQAAKTSVDVQVTPPAPTDPRPVR